MCYIPGTHQRMLLLLLFFLHTPLPGDDVIGPSDPSGSCETTPTDSSFPGSSVGLFFLLFLRPDPLSDSWGDLVTSLERFSEELTLALRWDKWRELMGGTVPL